MDSLHREGKAGVVVDVLTEIQLLILLEGSVYLKRQIFQTSVANHHYSAVNAAFRLDGSPKIVDVDGYLQIRVKYLGILECSKELTISVPVKMTGAVLQAFYRYYKGLQR